MGEQVTGIKTAVGKDRAGDHGGGGQEKQAPCSLTDKLDGSHTAVYGILRLKARMEG